MRSRFNIVLLCALLCASANAEQQPKARTVRVTGEIVPAFDRNSKVTVLLNGATAKCESWRARGGGTLCGFEVARTVETVRIKVHARGFKPRYFNAQLPAWTGEPHTVVLGSISLVRSPLPVVRQVLEGRLKDGKRFLSLTVENTLSRDFLIKHIAIAALRPGNGTSCAAAPMVVYRIEEELSVSGGGQGTIDAQGNYVQLVGGTAYTIPIRTTLSRFECNGETKLEIRMPVSMVLPAKSFSEVRVVLPKEFRLREKSWLGTPRRNPRLPRLTGDTSQFKSFMFVLRTGTGEEADIHTRHPHGTRLFDRMSFPFGEPFD